MMMILTKKNTFNTIFRAPASGLKKNPNQLGWDNTANVRRFKYPNKREAELNKLAHPLRTLNGTPYAIGNILLAWTTPVETKGKRKKKPYMTLTFVEAHDRIIEHLNSIPQVGVPQK
jgi:hypothetical protein